MLSGVVVVALIVLAVRRPRVPRSALPVAAIALVHLVLAGRPLFRFGFHWLANANGDMGYYVLSATSLLTSGLREPVNRTALASGHDFATLVHSLYQSGVRVGADVVLSALSATTGRFAADLYMPLILSVSMCGVCAAGALAMQFATRARAATIAAALLAVSPLATYGVVQQLLPQVWGLALAAALFALLARPELHGRARPRLAELAPVWILAVALFIVYVELAAALTVSYGIYLAVLAARRRLSPLGALRLWAPVAAGLVLVVNLYLPREIGFVTGSARAGVASFGGLQLFGRSLVPTALPAIVGFQNLFAPLSGRLMPVSIVAAMVALVLVLGAAAATARRGSAACIVIVGDVALGVFLALESSDFGLFKLYMYAQPFLAAAVGAWFAGTRKRFATVVFTAIFVLLVAVQARTQASYVSQSVHPTDLRNASSADLLPAFRSSLARADTPLVSVTDNVPLTSLEGAAASRSRHRLEFSAGNPFELPSTTRTFRLPGTSPSPVKFAQSRRVVEILAHDRCELSMSSGSQDVLNRRQLPEGVRDLVPVDCARASNLLAFVVSSVSQTFYSRKKSLVSFWQLEGDPAFPGRTMSGFGRYALLEAVNPTPGARLELTFSTSSVHDPALSFRLPAATVTGQRRLSLPVVGAGSARVFSKPLRPQMIDGNSYLLLDMGRAGFFPHVPRPGLTGLWGRTVKLDPRQLTSYVRDVSLVSSRVYTSMTIPASVRAFPRDLGNENLEYSGIFEDGWVGRDAYVVLSPRRASQFVLQADVVPAAGQHLTVAIDGRRVWSKPVAAGPLDIRLPVARHPRKDVIRLHWSQAERLSAQDPRPAPAHLRFLGFARPPAVLGALPAGLSQPGLETEGVLGDGWLERRSSVVLASGPRANLVLRADAPAVAGRQHLRVLVNRRLVWSRPVVPGAVEMRVPVPATTTTRRVEIVWSRARVLGPGDPRRASARLTYLGAVRIRAPHRLRIPGDLRDPHLAYSGLSLDGWAGRRVHLVLAGGPAATLVVRANVLRSPLGQHVAIVVDGVVASSRAVRPGSLVLRVPVRPAARRRHVELQWSTVSHLAPPDARKAAARLSYVALVPRPAK